MSKESEYRDKIRYNSGEYDYGNGVDLNETKITGRNITVPGEGIDVIPSNRDSYGYRVPKKGVTNKKPPTRGIYSPIDQGNKKGKKNKTVRITIPKGEVRRMADIPKKTLMQKLMERHPKLMKIRY